MTYQKDKLQQMPLEFGVRSEMKREDFMISECNKEAYDLLDSWPNWLGSGVFIFGPKGCGKSHLANLFVDKVWQRIGKPAAVKIIDADAVNMRNFKRIAEQNSVIIIENVNAKCNNEALFHLYNQFNQPEKYMLWTSEFAPNQIKFALKDLQSRINALPCAQIKEPDDVMLQMLVVKLFDDRQLHISEETLNYIVKNATRSFAYIEKLVAQIDEISLAYQCAVNYIVVKRAMDYIAAESELEPDLFDDYIN